jgi:hypothetical protein
MKRKKRKMFETPEERAEWELRSEATDRMLQERLALIKAELEAKGQVVRDVDYYVEVIKAERAAKGEPA